MTNAVNSYQFCGRATARIARSWIKREQDPGRPVPWTPLSKRLSECTVAFISSAGVAMLDDAPFDQEGERQNPWWGDPSYRILPRTATEQEVKLYHLHIHPRIAEQDLNTTLPLQRLLEFEARGEIGRSAAQHYSYMGYILEPQVLLEQSTPDMVRNMRRDEVDVVLLVPG